MYHRVANQTRKLHNLNAIRRNLCFNIKILNAQTPAASLRTISSTNVSQERNDRSLSRRWNGYEVRIVLGQPRKSVISLSSSNPAILRHGQYHTITNRRFTTGDNKTTPNTASSAAANEPKPRSTNNKDDDDYDPPTAAQQTTPTPILQQLRSIPNIITLSRILSTPLISHLIITHQYPSALTLCLIFGLSDILDGYIAKTYSLATVLGTYLDPLADKLIINIVAVSLWYDDGMLPLPIVVLWIGRDVGLMAATYYYARLATREGEWLLDPSRTPLKVEPSLMGKVNTVLQFVTLGSSLGFAMGGLEYDVVLGLCWITGGTTILSGWQYSYGASLVASGNNLRESVDRRNRILHDKVKQKSQDLGKRC